MIELIKEIIEQDGLAQKNRKREIVHRRIYLFRKLREDGHTLKGIGSLFNMNHATILHGLKTYKYLKLEKKQLCYFYIKGAEAELNNPYVTNIEFYNKTFKKTEQ
jgi:hypothetical protein